MWRLRFLIPLLGALRVTQEPGELRVAAGDTVALGCRVEVAERGALLRMEWVRDGAPGVLCATRLNFTVPLPPSPCPTRAPGVQLAWQPPRATLSLPRAQGNDSGRYLCRVTLEIPLFATATGNGTELSVSPAAAVGGHRAALLWGLVGALGGTALLLGTALLGYRWRHRSSDTAIYMNTMSRSALDPKKRRPPPKPKNKPYQQQLPRARCPPPDTAIYTSTVSRPAWDPKKRPPPPKPKNTPYQQEPPWARCPPLPPRP